MAKQLAEGAGWPWGMKPGSPRTTLTNDRNGVTPEEVRAATGRHPSQHSHYSHTGNTYTSAIAP